MVLNEDKQNPCCIRSYQPGQLILQDKSCINHNVLITDQQKIRDWGDQDLDNPDQAAWQPFIDHKPDIVLLGTGAHFKMLSPKQLLPLTSRGIGVECMDTAAACRSFVALQAECRRVWAALIV